MGFSDADYWESRYSNNEGEDHEWLADGYETILDTCLCHIPVEKSAFCLIIGCGDSSLSVDLALRRPELQVISTDISVSCISKMRARSKHISNLTWAVAGMLHLLEADQVAQVVKVHGGFDYVIEKASIDALLADEKSQWTPSKSASHSVHQCVDDVSRVLRETDGVFLSFSFHQPHFRLQHYINPVLPWGLSCSTLANDNGFHFYFYIMKRGQETHWEPLQPFLELNKQYNGSRNVDHNCTKEHSDNDVSQDFLQDIACEEFSL